jgi:predicted CxxxxCH...CXXCH cytochrome family protein
MMKHRDIHHSFRVMAKIVVMLSMALFTAGVAQAAIQCYECHGTTAPVDYRPVDSPYRNITTGGFVGNHSAHMGDTATAATCTPCHNNSGYTSSHRDGAIQFSANINTSNATGQYKISGVSVTFKNQTSIPVLGSCDNVNCHFESATDTWGTAQYATADGTTCNKCHNTTNLNVSAKGGKHSKHTDYYDKSNNPAAANACTHCHPNHAAEAKPFAHATSGSAGHRNISVQFSSFAGSTGTSAGGAVAYPNYLPSSATVANATCSNIYCHSQGTSNVAAYPAPNTSPVWNGTMSTDCGGCHNGGAAMNTLSHGKHVGATANTSYDYQCVNCHAVTIQSGNTTLMANYTAHVNRSVNVAYDGFAGGVNGSYNGVASPMQKAPGSANGTCANYCHSQGRYSSNFTASAYKPYSTPVWGGAMPANCTGCHGGFSTAFKKITSASHNKHVGSGAKYGYCVRCHGATVNTQTTTSDAALFSNFTAHANKSVNVAYDATGGGANGKYNGSASPMAKAPGTATGFCATYCHSQGRYNGGSDYTAAGMKPYSTAKWGATISANCIGCHGNDATTFRPITTGRHKAHINNAAVLGTNNNFNCVECHLATTGATNNRSITTADNHANALINYTGSKAGKRVVNNGKAGCTTAYCHSDGYSASITYQPMTSATRSWKLSASGLGCNGCHGAGNTIGTPEGHSSNNSHPKHLSGFTDNKQCRKCHAGTVSGDGTLSNYSANHLNKNNNVRMSSDIGGSYSGSPSGTCSSTYCHGSSATPAWGSGALAAGCSACHGSNNNGDLSVGTTAGHALHVNTATTFNNITGGNKHVAGSYVFGCKNCHPTTQHTTGPASANSDANIGGANLSGASYVAGGTSYTDAKNYKFTYGSCSNAATACHSDGNGGAARGGTPAWNTAKSASNCGVCHSKRTDASRTWTVAHDKHLRNYSSNTNFTCNSCHSIVAATNSTLQNTSTARKLHPNGTKNVNPNAWAGGAYNGTQCNSVYCHSDGKASPNYVSNVAWASAINNCVQCHGGKNASGVLVQNPGSFSLTTSHTRHVGGGTRYSYTCNTCHAKTVTFGSSTTLMKNYTGAIYHVNKTRDVRITTGYTGTGWNGTTCNVYCHSDGQAAPAAYASQGWSGTVGCTGCHVTTGLATGTHAKHVNGTYATYTCDACHAKTAVSNTALKNYTGVLYHVNNSRDVRLSATYSGSASGSPVTCSTSNCHGTSSPTWGTNNADNTLCTKCHGANASPGTYANVSSATVAPGARTTAGTADPGFHQKHLTASRGYSNPITCRQCHTVVSTINQAGHIDNALPADITWGTLAKNDIKGGNPATAYSAGTCSNVYCHDYARFKNGWGGDATTNRTPVWTTAFGTTPNTAADCKKCHGYPPASPHDSSTNCTGCHSHVASDNLSFNDRSKHINGAVEGGGESAGGSACAACHGDFYNATQTVYSMHSNTAGISYKHYMDNDAATYSNLIPDGASTNTTSRRCLMCHVDHNIFKTAATATKGRAFNLRDSATGSTSPTAGYNNDYKLCLSCHTTEKTKFTTTPNGNNKTMPIPYPSLTFANATSVLTFSTHGYPVFSHYTDALGKSKFEAVCVKCHNDSIGGNGDLGPKSSKSGQDSAYKFGTHNSTIPSRFSVFSNMFYQGTVSVYDAGAKTVQVTPNPNWATDAHKGHYIVVTGGAGNNQRALIKINNADTVTLFAAFGTALDATSKVDIVDDNLAIDNVCFSCHSRGKNGEKPFASYSTSDWYGQKPMSRPLVRMKDLFTGDSGTLSASLNKATSVAVTVQNSWAADALKGYLFKAPGGTRTINANTAVTGPGSTTLTIASLTSGTGPFQILKPSGHPLDSYGRHDSYERVSATSGWNKGDQGAVTTATSATEIADSSKLWTGSEFNGLKIFFPGNFDSSGNPAQSTITGGASAGVVIFDAIAGYPPAVGDNYYVGTRHVSCADCHNTHASFKNPEGPVTSGTATTLVADDSKNVKGWTNGKWVGYLLKLRKSTGFEQIRYITGFTLSSGTYTVSLAWTTNPAEGDDYEVLMGDKWTSAGQSGGRAGSGSSGVWGTVVTGFPAITRGDGTLTSVPLANFKKIENVFDNVSSTGLGGSTVAGQRDLCIRCHSNYAYGTATPVTPSGGWTSTYNTAGPARSTDVAAEFNPQNVAHHAVYARGNNQPITATGQTAGATSYYNSNWPKYSTGTIEITTGGAATITSGTLPSTVLPGWFVYVSNATPPATATTNWYQITTITSGTSFTLKPNPGTAVGAGTAYAVTAGLGNNFVPPYGPWSVLRCTDCHGSTKTDPVGPHASINKYLIRDADTTLQFEWYNGTGVVTINYQASLDTGAYKLNNAYDKGYFCFNCHRADVYGSEQCWLNKKAPNYTNYARISHGQLSGADGARISVARGAAGGTVYPQFCRHCHGGDKIGGIHGTNRAKSSQGDNRPQSVRFLNGATWNNGIGIAVGNCYTQAASTGVSNCSSHGGGKANTYTVNYNYIDY